MDHLWTASPKLLAVDIHAQTAPPSPRRRGLLSRRAAAGGTPTEAAATFMADLCDSKKRDLEPARDGQPKWLPCSSPSGIPQ